MSADIRKISDGRILEGKTENISMMQLRHHVGEIITQVQMGKTFNITKAGKLVASLSSPEPTALELGAALRNLGEAKGVY